MDGIDNEFYKYQVKSDYKNKLRLTISPEHAQASKISI